MGLDCLFLLLVLLHLGLSILHQLLEVGLRGLLHHLLLLDTFQSVALLDQALQDVGLKLLHNAFKLLLGLLSTGRKTRAESTNSALLEGGLKIRSSSQSSGFL